MSSVKNLSFPGFINGGLRFNTVSTPPIVSSGIYDVNNSLVHLSADVTLATSDAFGQCSTSLQSFLHYLVVMNKVGQCRFLPYGEGAVSGATGNISSITGAGTTKTLTAATGTVGAHTNKILVVLGNNGFPVGVYKITGGNGTSTYTFEGPTALTGGASGTWAVYERISTLHGTGSNTAITVDADVLRYTPSLGENGWAAGIAAFDIARNGYYLNLSGYTDWRVIGTFSTNTTPNTLTDIFSYRTGRNKADNDWMVHTVTSVVTDAIRWTTIVRVFGCDYVFVDSAGVGSEWTMRRNTGFVNSLFGTFTATGGTSSIYYGASTTNTHSLNAPLDAHGSSMNQVSNVDYGLSTRRTRSITGQILKPLATGLVTGASAVYFEGSIEL